MGVADLEAGFESIDCILCGSGEQHKLTESGQHGLPAHLVLCKKCGLGYLSPRWNSERYARFYSTEYDKYYRVHLVQPLNQNSTVILSNPKPPTALLRMQNAAIVPPAVNRILDIGSGNGFFADEARSVFPAAEYFAIEPSANCAEHLRNRKVKLLAVDVDSDWDLSCSFTFELVNMRHVLEHFADPLKVLLKVRNVLSDDGRVYIAVPNSMNPGLPLIRYFVRAVHTFYFNRKTLEALCRKAGLKPLLTIEGDNFNKHELVMVCAKGEVSVEPVNTYREQLEVFRKYIDHETTWHYRLRSLFRRAFNVSSVAGDD